MPYSKHNYDNHGELDPEPSVNLTLAVTFLTLCSSVFFEMMSTQGNKKINLQWEIIDHFKCTFVLLFIQIAFKMIKQQLALSPIL